MTTAELPDDLNDYYKAKARDLPTRKRSCVDDLMDALDHAVIDALNHGGSNEAIDVAFEAVINHPDSTWKRDVLSYRIRQVHYK
tara:strand:+ start:727 stop:978 length:252 start_codon:yes stop_codon:yes gene_type:complete